MSSFFFSLLFSHNAPHVFPFTYDGSKIRRGGAPDGSDGRGSQHGDNGFGAIGDVASNTVSLHHTGLAHGLGALTDAAVEIGIRDALGFGLELTRSDDGSLVWVLAPEGIFGKVEACGGEPRRESIHGEGPFNHLSVIIVFFWGGRGGGRGMKKKMSAFLTSVILCY